MSVAANLERILSELPREVHLVAVSKFHDADVVKEAYDAGQRLFGESRVQELSAKAALLPTDIKWHFIGHLQTNKVKKLMAVRPAMIESIDSIRLLEAVDEAAAAASFTANVLMQVHVAREETKFGFYPEELLDFFKNRGFESLRATHICGVMGMASNTGDMERVRRDFRDIHDVFSTIKTDATLGLRGFDTLSMGMSGDWPLAIEEGANVIRVGSAIFGPRQY